MTEAQLSFQRLNEIVFELREKCPWDRKQTKESLRHLTIEETYELADAILEGDYEEIKVELGDLMLHLLFYASLAQDKGKFDIHQVLESQIEKLIRRHPHVYGDMVGATEEEIKKNWEAIKAQERAESGRVHFQSVLDGVPDSMPSLIKAHRMQEKAAQMGFDWTESEDVLDKIQEEIAEFKEADNAVDKVDEMGDILFSLVNYCRHMGINAEDALAKSNQKFKDRYQHMEKAISASDLKMPELSMEEMETYWKQAKSALG
ncbi:MAG: nucleoside triphosphate pyrophosphohydrolase [Bacteroidota bacterium]